jgi:hypothetical protein
LLSSLKRHDFPAGVTLEASIKPLEKNIFDGFFSIRHASLGETLITGSFLLSLFS